MARAPAAPDPWDAFDDAPADERADPWAQFADAPVKRGKATKGSRKPADPATAAAPPIAIGRPTGAAHDGDTFALSSGGSARLYGADAFELDQQGVLPSGEPLPLGALSRGYLQSRAAPAGVLTYTGRRSYDRPIVSLRDDGGDVARGSITAGLAVPTPKYLRSDPKRLDEYVEAQREAIASEAGAYAGTYQRPDEYRHQGTAAPVRGKIPMSQQQRREYAALLRNPKTTEAQLAGWIKAQGHDASNVGEILKFMQRNPHAQPSTYFQQGDVLDQPVLPDGPGLPARVLGALNEGVADTLGAPVDIVNAGLGLVGLPASDKPFLGSESIRSGLHALGAGQATEAYAPRSDVERYGQSAARGIGQVALPVGATLGLGARGVLRGGEFTGGVLRQAFARTAREASARPALTLATELGGGVGAGLGGQAARDEFPGNPYADLAGQLVGGVAGGVGAASLGSRVRRPVLTARGPVDPAPAASEVIPDTIEADLSGGGRVLPDGRLQVDIVGEAAPAALPSEMPPVRAIAPEPQAAATVEGPPPAGVVADPWVAFEDAPVVQSAAMDDGLSPASVSTIAPDDPDIWAGFADAPAISGPVLDDMQPNTRSRPLDQRVTPVEMADLARTVNPEDIRPIPSNQVESLDEAVRANPGTLRDVAAPNERDALPSYRLREGGPVRKDPIDLLGWLRTKGGVRDQGGELSHMGVDNKARSIDFAKSEGFLGRLVNDDGMNLDDAAHNAWEAGLFPDHAERPTIAEFLDAVRDTHVGGPGRVFHPDDYAAIDAFNSARAQRGAVEAAAQEGTPLAEDIGHPIGPDDLEANQPPATAYEDLPSVGGYAGNIRLDGLNSPADIRRALIGTDAKVGGFDAARRGVISHGETAALAREMGMTADDLLKRREGQALNAEQALAARSILAKSASELVGMAGKAVRGSDVDKAAFRQAWVRHVAIQEQVAGATAEAGRALQQFRMTADSKASVGRIHRVLIDQAGGDDRIEDAAKAILDLQNDGATPGEIAKFTQQAMKPKLKDKLIELYYNSLLSGVQTHVVNILSNAITAGLQIPEHATAASIGAARRALLQSRASTDRVLMSEVGARIVGLMQGTREGLAAFARTARTGVVPDHVSKVEAQTQEAISGLKGMIIRTPTRLLSAEDELFKAVGRRMEINGLASRQARLEGLRGDDLRQRIVELSTNPTDEMVEKSMDYARYLTFQRPLGTLGNLMTAATQHAPLLKLIVPFVRTPTNILKFAAERSPAAPILKEWRADFVAGGARRDLAVAKMALGSGLGMLASRWAQEGTITGGGPADKGARALMLADGWQPYSVKLGDKYYSYQRFDPLASTLGVAADLVETSEHMTEAQREKAAMLITAAIIKNLSNKVWLSGITNVSQAIEDPDRYAGGFLAQMAGSIAVPALVAQTARVVDPVLRDAREPIDRIRSRVPMLSRALMPKRDVFGEVITSEGGVGPDLASPMRVSTARNDPVVRELLAIEASVGKLPRKVAGRELSPAEYDAYQQMAGRFLRAGLEEAISDPAWQTIPFEERNELVDKVARRARRDAREGLFNVRRP